MRHKNDEEADITELERIKLRYYRRQIYLDSNRYSPLQSDVYLSIQERERKIINLIRLCEIAPVNTKRILEIGCGEGQNLLQFIRLGFSPGNLVGIDLLEDRCANARQRLPSSTKIISGDGAQADFPDGAFDIVFQSTVFSSILDENFQSRLACRMSDLTKPGGGILWYDFVYNNPANPDVCGIPFKRIKELFPGKIIRKWRLTLAPPISRRVTRIHPCLYAFFNFNVFLRTHLLCWISSPK